MSRLTTCPHCSARLRVSDQITDKTLICPHCLADVNNGHPSVQVRPADINTDVKRGMSVGSIILAVLITLSVLGVVIVLIAGHNVTGEASLGVLLYLVLFFAALEVLVSIAIVRGLIRWGVSGVQGASAGRLLGIALLLLGTIVTVVIFFFFTCWGLLALNNL